jgi:hypothetical protein
VGASFCLEFLVPFVSRQKTQNIIISFRSWPRGPSSFPLAEKNQNATAASDAMEGSGLANVVCTAPAKAEERL